MSQKNIHPLLARYLASLAARPIYTKSATAGNTRDLLSLWEQFVLISRGIAGTLFFLQDIVANHIAGAQIRPSKNPPLYLCALNTAKIDIRALKLAIYGFFVSAPLNHVLVDALQKALQSKEPSSSIVAILERLKKEVEPTEELLRVCYCRI